MLRVRAAPVPLRLFWATVFALTLAMRLLTPNGFMPAFDHGRLTIVDCPGSSMAPMPSMPGMGHDPNKGCQTCPHAIATGAGLADAAPLNVGVAAFAVVAQVAWREFIVRAAISKQDRPPAIGPPVSARFIVQPS